MVSEAVRTKKSISLYKAYKMKQGETMKIDPHQESFFLTEKAAAADLIENMVDLNKENPLEGVEKLIGETIYILKVVIYTSRIPEEDWKSEITQEGDSIRLPVGKYQKTMNILPVTIESFEMKPNKADPKTIDVSKIVFAK